MPDRYYYTGDANDEPSGAYHYDRDCHLLGEGVRVISPDALASREPSADDYCGTCFPVSLVPDDDGGEE